MPDAPHDLDAAAEREIQRLEDVARDATAQAKALRKFLAARGRVGAAEQRDPNATADAELRRIFEERTSRLTSTRVDSTVDIDTMESPASNRRQTDEARRRISAANVGEETKATKFWQWLDSQHLTAADWSRAHSNPENGKPRWSPSAVRGWMQPAEAEGARSIPEEAAELIAAESGGAVPALDDTWPSGISRQRRRKI